MSKWQLSTQLGCFFIQTTYKVVHVPTICPCGKFSSPSSVPERTLRGTSTPLEISRVFLSRKFSHSVNPDKILDVLLNVQYFRLFHCQTMLVVEEINSMECTGLTALRNLSRPRPVDTFPVATAAAVHQAIAIALVCNPMQLFLVPVGFVDRSGRRMWRGLMPFQFANS